MLDELDAPPEAEPMPLLDWSRFLERSRPSLQWPLAQPLPLLCGSQSSAEAPAEAEPCEPVRAPALAEPEPCADWDTLPDGVLALAPAEALPDGEVLDEDCDRWLMVESCVVLALPETSPTFTLDLPRASIVVLGLTCTSVEDDCCEPADCWVEDWDCANAEPKAPITAIAVILTANCLSLIISPIRIGDTRFPQGAFRAFVGNTPTGRFGPAA